MKGTWSFYRLSDGMLLSRKLLSSSIGKQFARDFLGPNTPEGCAAIEGHYDHLSQRVDLQTKQVVDYVPPQPDADHEWHTDSRRWRKKGEVLAREQRRTQALADIEALERKQLRAVAELTANPNDAEARKHFDLRQAQITELRKQI